MSTALENVLGYMPLTEALRATSSGIPNPFPPEFFTVKPANRIIGDRARYIKIYGQRQTSTLAKYGSPAKRHNLMEVDDQPVRCLHSNESFVIDMLMLQKLQSFESYTQDMGVDFVKYQLDEAAKRHQNLRIATTSSVLRYGNLYWDANGNFLPTSSGAFETYGFGVPASHQNQIGGRIPISWALSQADIPGNIRAIRQFAAQETGIEFETALYGINVPTYMLNNDSLQYYMARDATTNNRYLMTGEIPAGLLGIKNWIPVYTTFFQDVNGSNQTLWDNDLLTLVPSVPQPNKMNWWDMYEGSYMVPRTLDIQRDPASALRNMELVYGMGAYAQMSLDPPSINVYNFDTWLPGLRNPNAIFQCTVAF